MTIEEAYREFMNDIILNAQDEGNFEETVFFVKFVCAFLSKNEWS